MPNRQKSDRSNKRSGKLLSSFPAILLLTFALAISAGAQLTGRKVISRTNPSYPELARQRHLSGKVKLELVIAPSGSVKSTRLVGGNPVFEESAREAVRQWKFEAAARESKMVILIEFSER